MPRGVSMYFCVVTREMVDWYVASAVEITVETLTAQLRRTHESLSKIFPSDTASYGRTLAQQRKRNAVLIEQAVTESRSYTEQEAVSAQPPLREQVADGLHTHAPHDS